MKPSVNFPRSLHTLWLLALVPVLLLAACGGGGGSDLTDEDGDGWLTPADCDDTNSNIHPLAVDIPYDDIDQDCDGEDLTDVDRDGYDGQEAGGTDCDDTDPARHPTAVEIPYDGIDQDCSGADLIDADGDTYPAEVAGGDDCDDTDAAINPGATEIPYDGIDQNCDGRDWGGGPVEGDADEDGFVDHARPEGIDCDDSDPDIYPGAPERCCNERDDDCDGLTDEDLPDMDGDDWPACCDCDDYDPSINPGAVDIPYNDIDEDCDGLDLKDLDGDGHDADFAGGGDCDDNDPLIYPGAPEICNLRDDNCDGQTDETFAASGDADGDLWFLTCDCDDSNPLVNPGTFETVGDLTDNNCNNLIDEVDADFDGHFDSATGGDDCNDADPTIYSGAPEIPYDVIDQDCNGADLTDVDGDGHVAVEVGGDDCDDDNPEAYPGHLKDCSDPADNNCNGTANEDCGPGTGEDIQIPAGPFMMGQIEGLYADQTPQHTVQLRAYAIDKYEVTMADYRRCVNAGYCTPLTLPVYSYGDEFYWINQARGLHPAINVDYDDAQEYCHWLGRRLPTEAEWEKAARGAGSTTQGYPWGEVEYSVPAGGGAPVRDPVSCDLANHTQLCTGEPCRDDVVAVDEYPLGTSPFGLFNAAGNVWEWVADWYDPAYYAIPGDDPQGPATGTLRVARGGGFLELDYFIEVVMRLPLSPGVYADSLGFRCARSYRGP